MFQAIGFRVPFGAGRIDRWRRTMTSSWSPASSAKTLREESDVFPSGAVLQTCNCLRRLLHIHRSARTSGLMRRNAMSFFNWLLCKPLLNLKWKNLVFSFNFPNWIWFLPGMWKHRCIKRFMCWANLVLVSPILMVDSRIKNSWWD
jgi:hypothetical protein